MPTFRVWIKKSVLGPAGPIEIGLGGTHEVDCSPAQVPSERLALFSSYRDEVDRLLEVERLGLPLQPPSFRSAPKPPPPRPTEPPRTTPVEPLRESTPPDAAASDAGWVTAERSRMFIAELQERLHRKLKAASAPPTVPEDAASGEEASSSPFPVNPEHPPIELAALLLKEDLS